MSTGMKLEKVELDVLRQIAQDGIVRGAELKARLRLSSVQELQKAIGTLSGQSLVAVSGSTIDANETLLSYFSVRPSAAGIVQSLIGRST